MDQERKSFIKDLPEVTEVDKKTIEALPWAQSMWTTLQNGLEKSYINWCNAVVGLCDNENDIKEWVATYIEQFEETCYMMVCDMEKLKARVMAEIEELLAQLQQLCNDLQIDMPVIGKANSTYYEELQHVKKLVDEYGVVCNARTKEVNLLKQKQLSLCHALGKEPYILKERPLPSAQELERFHQHLEKLEAEVFDRTEKFLLLKEEIVAIFKELKQEPSTQFEKDVLSPNNSDFLVTNENMTLLTQLHSSMVHQKESVKDEITLLRNKVDEFWNLLDVDMLERESFRDKHRGNSVDVLEALRSEVKKCEQLKRANIKIFVDKIRKDLDQLWHKCHCDQSQLANFKFFHSDCYTEDLLELHEMELQKWTRYYEDNKELLDLLEKHKSAWNKLLGLEENEAGPNRYKNRGGQLLKEEKVRNKLSKQIPQIEEDLIALSDKYEEHYGVPFTSYGETVQDYIFHMHADRENTKQQKLSARKIQKEQTLSTPAKSALSLFPSTSTTNLKAATPHIVKRKRELATPLTDYKKKAKLTPRLVLTDIKNKRSPPKIKITTVTGRTKRLSTERKKRIEKIRRLSAQKSKSSNTHEASTDYDQFHMRPLAYSSVCGTIEED